MKKIYIVGASGKLGQYMVQHALNRGYEVIGVCREKSVNKLDRFKDRMTIIPGATNNRQVIERAVRECDAVLTVLVPWGCSQLLFWDCSSSIGFCTHRCAPYFLLRMAYNSRWSR